MTIYERVCKTVPVNCKSVRKMISTLQWYPDVRHFPGVNTLVDTTRFCIILDVQGEKLIMQDLDIDTEDRLGLD